MNPQIPSSRPTAPACPNPACLDGAVHRNGVYLRKSDHATVHRFRCQCCGVSFSEATGTPCFAQKKRHLNAQVLAGLASAMSQNRLAMLLQTTRVTIARKLVFLGADCAQRNAELRASKPLAADVQFDELETFEHTKCKPLSVALAVESTSRRILGLNVASMPANGKLAEISRRKYGKRPDGRIEAMTALLSEIAPLCASKLHLLSDQCPRYGKIVRSTLAKDPERKITYVQTKGGRGSSTGQGELKKLRFDPLFSLNHTCAMLRANINRLFRKTWNTTKRVARLSMHLEIYAYFHNSRLT